MVYVWNDFYDFVEECVFVVIDDFSDEVCVDCLMVGVEFDFVIWCVEFDFGKCGFVF